MKPQYSCHPSGSEWDGHLPAGTFSNGSVQFHCTATPVQQSCARIQALSQQCPENDTWRVSHLYFRAQFLSCGRFQAIDLSGCFLQLSGLFLSCCLALIHQTGFFLILVLPIPFYIRNIFTTISSLSDPKK